MSENNTQTISEQVREIKQSFRLLMNGVTAQSMRDKGVDYHLNWGASLTHLREMAAGYKPDHVLAQELWKENIRECKIIATMLMPVDSFNYDLAMLWIEQTKTQEIAEIATMNLYQHLPYATEMALLLISKPETMAQLHGFTILSRLFANKNLPDDIRDINEFIDQARAALLSNDISVKHSAWNALSHFADIDELCHMAAKNALKSTKMDDWL